MGILLEKDESDPSSGVVVKNIDPKGQTATRIRQSKEDAKSVICIRDKILAVNGIQCQNSSFERVLELIQDSNDDVDLMVGRHCESVVVTWSNGVSIAAKSGEYFGNLANESSFLIPYSCRSGSCGTCEQSIIIDGRKEKQTFIRPCVARVPKIAPCRINVVPSRRFQTE
jgi:ferredoxin